MFPCSASSSLKLQPNFAGDWNFSHKEQQHSIVRPFGWNTTKTLLCGVLFRAMRCLSNCMCFRSLSRSLHRHPECALSLYLSLSPYLFLSLSLIYLYTFGFVPAAFVLMARTTCSTSHWMCASVPTEEHEAIIILQSHAKCKSFIHAFATPHSEGVNAFLPSSSSSSWTWSLLCATENARAIQSILGVLELFLQHNPLVFRSM